MDGGAEHIHTRIFRPLPGGGDVELHSYQDKKGAEEDIAYFWHVQCLSVCVCMCSFLVSGAQVMDHFSELGLKFENEAEVCNMVRESVEIVLSAV